VDVSAPAAPVPDAVTTDNVIDASERDAPAGVTIGGGRRSRHLGEPALQRWSGRHHSRIGRDNVALCPQRSRYQRNATGREHLVRDTDRRRRQHRSVHQPNLHHRHAGSQPAADQRRRPRQHHQPRRTPAQGITITGSNAGNAQVVLRLGTSATRSVTALSATTWSYTLGAADFDLMGQGPSTITGDPDRPQQQRQHLQPHGRGGHP